MSSAVERLWLSRFSNILISRGWLISFAVFFSVGGLALANGGYFPVSWGWGAVGFLVLALFAFVGTAGESPGRLGVALIVSLACLTVWTAVSIAWTLDVTHTVDEVERGIVYFAAIVSVLLVLRRSGEQAVVLGLWAAIAAVSVYGLAIWLFPQYLGYEDAQFRHRLTAPVGYWNAFGVLAAIGTLLALGLAARGSAFLRCLAAGSVVVTLLTLYFTFSRGSWLALAGGSIAMVALERRRLQLLVTACVVGPWAAAAVWVASRSDALTRSDASLGSIAHDGHGVAAVVLLLAAAAGFAVLVFDAVETRVRPSAGAMRACGAVMVVAVLVGVSGVSVRYGAPWTLARNAYHSFNTHPSTAGSLNSRLFNLSSDGRAEQFQTAWQDAKAHPWLGSGAGTFDIYWNQNRRAGFTVHDVHNLYLETLAELGPVGLLFLVAALAVPIVAVFRARGRPLAAVAFGGYVVFLLHAAVDWDWEMPAVTLAGLFCGVAVLAPLKRDGPGRPLRRSVRLVGGVVTLGVAAFAVLTLIGNIALSASSTEKDASDYRQAAGDARQAMNLLPWSAEPWRRLGEAQAGTNDLLAARISFRKAIATEPHDWTLWFDLAQVTTGKAQAAALARAFELNPLSSELANWKKDHANGQG